ncbi:MAG: amidohydrolase family protein [Ferrovibrionaceae bacterium]
MTAPVIDAHHHFWDPGRAEYPWMAAPELAPIRKPYGPGDLVPLIAAHGIDATILVQCSSSTAETEAMLATAAAHPFIAGVVGWVDLTAADVGARLDRLMAPKLVGIRHQVHDEGDPAWLSRADVRRGLAAVFARGLAFDLLVRTRELPAAVAAARALPQGRFILDHAAKPPIATGFDDVWAERLAALADCPNVWCKISGLVTEADWHDWDVDRLRPFVEHAVRLFGPGRLIFGSDWPVCLLAAEYGAVKAAAEALLPRDAFGANAVAAYRLFRAQPA